MLIELVENINLVIQLSKCLEKSYLDDMIQKIEGA
jgi:hypothetical protein